MASFIQGEENPCRFHEPDETRRKYTTEVHHALINSAIMF